MTSLTVTKEDISAMTAEDIAELAARLEKDDYNNPFEALQDWHLFRAIAFQRQELQDLIEPYLYLLDLEAHDES
jgi:hypothetical protein